MKTPRRKEVRRLLKQPLQSPADLERLTAYVAERRAMWRERFRIALVIAAIITLISSFIATSGTPRSDRFILPAMLILAIAVATPFAMRRWWSHPRLLAAQRRLLQDRRGSGPDLTEPEALISDLETRINQAEALFTRDRTASTPPPNP